MRIPRFPSPEPGSKISVPSAIMGLFLNGVPIPNQLQSESFEGRNLWHFDLLAMQSQDAHAAPTALLLLTKRTHLRMDRRVSFAFCVFWRF